MMAYNRKSLTLGKYATGQCARRIVILLHGKISLQEDYEIINVNDK